MITIGRPEEALRLFLRTLDQFPKDLEVARVALRLLLAAGSTEDAQSLYRREATADPAAGSEFATRFRQKAVPSPQVEPEEEIPPLSTRPAGEPRSPR